MLGVVRFYCFRQGVTNVFDCLPEEAERLRKRLLAESWTIYHRTAV